MSAPDRAELELRLAEALAALAGLPHGTLEYRDALSTVHHLERLVLVQEDLPATIDPHAAEGRR